jgi:hypothetical protein
LALLFLAHFVGDVHQPLHVGFAEDLGGNTINVKWTNANGSTSPSNLHKVWDSDILHRAGLTSLADGTQLNQEITTAEASAWATFDLKSWAAESYLVARTKAYAQPDGSPVANNDTLGDTYFTAAAPVAREQLKKAGVRLATLINAAADGTLPMTMLTFQ